MSFGLKNVDATYKRLMIKNFKTLISRTVKVYIDDIVVKSEPELSTPSTWKKHSVLCKHTT